MDSYQHDSAFDQPKLDVAEATGLLQFYWGNIPTARQQQPSVILRRSRRICSRWALGGADPSPSAQDDTVLHGSTW